jgi:hypothetical protein
MPARRASASEVQRLIPKNPPSPSLPFAEARSSGFAGAALLCEVTVALVGLFPQGAPPLADASWWAYALLVGFPGLLAFILLLWSFEEFSKSRSDRSAVDSYILALGFGGASYGVAHLIGVRSPIGWVIPIGADFAPRLGSGTPLGYVGMLVLLLTGACLLARCVWHVGQATGERLFLVTGGLYVGAALSSPLLGSALFDFAPFLLALSFWKTKATVADTPIEGRRGWYDVPKIIVDATSRFWFADEGIFVVRPVLATLSSVVLGIIFTIDFIFQATQPYDASGFQSPVPPFLQFVEGLVLLGALCIFLLLSRWRYPRLMAEEVIARSRVKIPWADVSRVTLTSPSISKLSRLKIARGAAVSVTAGNKTHHGSIFPYDIPEFERLVGGKLGDKLQVT